MDNKITLITLVIVLVIVISVGIMVGTFCSSEDHIVCNKNESFEKSNNSYNNLRSQLGENESSCSDCLPDQSYCGVLPDSLTVNQQHSAPKNIVQPYFEQQARGEALMPNYQYYDWGFGTDLKDATYTAGALFMPPAQNYIPNYNIWANPHQPYSPNPITMNSLENSGFYNANF